MNRNGEAQAVGRVCSVICVYFLCMRQSWFYIEMVPVSMQNHFWETKPNHMSGHMKTNKTEY